VTKGIVVYVSITVIMTKIITLGFGKIFYILCDFFVVYGMSV